MPTKMIKISLIKFKNINNRLSNNKFLTKVETLQNHHHLTL